VDSWASAAEFRRQLELPFDLLSDWGRDVTPEYGAYNGTMMIANRYSFLIDKEGVVRYVQHSSLNEPRDLEGMKQAVEEVYAEQ